MGESESDIGTLFDEDVAHSSVRELSVGSLVGRYEIVEQVGTRSRWP